MAEEITGGLDSEVVGMRWEDVNKIIKWTLKNIKYLDINDIYLIEKATDACHLFIEQDTERHTAKSRG